MDVIVQYNPEVLPRERCRARDDSNSLLDAVEFKDRRRRFCLCRLSYIIRYDTVLVARNLPVYTVQYVERQVVPAVQ